MNRIFSGIQPTGNLHLGNYLGAIRQWVKMQHEMESLFCIVDLHAITVPQDPKALHEAILRTAAIYIACGIDPKKNIIFQQSRVPQHCELAWLLGTLTPLGWLNRMTQFKEKAGKHKENASLGLYGYPVLMAADILLYHTTHVPVGEDQKQHIELARDIAGAFNRFANKDYFKLPEPIIMEEAARVMSFRDGTKKMSKSDPSDYSRIHLLDSDDDIRQKIQKAKSDALPGITLEANRPEVVNLAMIGAASTGSIAGIYINTFENRGFSEFKSKLSEDLINLISPIRHEAEKLLQDKAHLTKIMDDGAERAEKIAAKTLKEVQQIFGF